MTRPLPSQAGRRLVIAHRGAKAYRPENTLAAYELAVEQGADMLEIDLHLSRDARIPITHDASLEHMGREGEQVADHSIDQLRAISHTAYEAASSGGSWQGLPDLAEVLDRFADRIPFNLEIKTDANHQPYPGLQRMALDEVMRRGILEQTLFSSFSDPVLAELRSLSPDARVGVLVDPRAPEGIFERAARVGAEAVNPHFVIADAELVRQAHDRGMAVYVYTVDEPERMGELFAIGVDGIFSNVPDVLREVVEGLS
ncbi:MAG: hypothetical protein GY944_07175 [bacterium]|nr:hypothetical protein [bacterium]